MVKPVQRSTTAGPLIVVGETRWYPHAEAPLSLVNGGGRYALLGGKAAPEIARRDVVDTHSVGRTG